MKPDKNFKMDRQVKKQLASSRVTKDQLSVFKNLMIQAQLSEGQAFNKTKFKQEDTDS